MKVFELMNELAKVPAGLDVHISDVNNDTYPVDLVLELDDKDTSLLLQVTCVCSDE